MSIKFIAIAAITIDGKIAKGPDHFSNWTSKEDKVFMRALLDKCDVVIVGNSTYKTAIKPLSKRNCIVFSKSAGHPPAIALGSSQWRAGRISESANLLYVNPRRTNVKKLIKKLGYKKIALLGGAQTYSYFLENNLLDELYLTIEPVIFGAGINLFSEILTFSKDRSNKSKRLKLIYIKKLNKQGSLLLKYRKYGKIRV